MCENATAVTSSTQETCRDEPVTAVNDDVLERAVRDIFDSGGEGYSDFDAIQPPGPPPWASVDVNSQSDCWWIYDHQDEYILPNQLKRIETDDDTMQ